MNEQLYLMRVTTKTGQADKQGPQCIMVCSAILSPVCFFDGKAGVGRGGAYTIRKDLQ